MGKKYTVRTYLEEEEAAEFEARRADATNLIFDQLAQIEDIVFSTPNDTELGAKVRKFVNDMVLWE